MSTPLVSSIYTSTRNFQCPSCDHQTEVSGTNVDNRRTEKYTDNTRPTVSEGVTRSVVLRTEVPRK